MPASALRKSVVQALGVKSPRIHKIGGDLVLQDQWIGVEHEVEYCNSGPTTQDAMRKLGWAYHADGSLRNNGAEWVFDGPAIGQEVIDRLNVFEGMAEQKKWQASFRTSTHVHIGFSQDTPYMDIPEDTLERVQKFLCLYYVLEEGFFGYAAQDRKLCGYCEPFSLCPDDFLALIRTQDPYTFAEVIRGSHRYYGCNPASLAKHGTIEFRHLPLQLKAKDTLDWINMLLRMKKWAYLSMGNSTPADVMREAGREVLVEAVFGSYKEQALQWITEEDFDHRLSVIEGAQSPSEPVGFFNIGTLNPILARYIKKHFGKAEAKAPNPAKKQKATDELAQRFAQAQAASSARRTIRTSPLHTYDPPALPTGYVQLSRYGNPSADPVQVDPNADVINASSRNPPEATTGDSFYNDAPHVEETEGDEF